jgi:hypothetical protein
MERHALSIVQLTDSFLDGWFRFGRCGYGRATSASWVPRVADAVVLCDFKIQPGSDYRKTNTGERRCTGDAS